MPIFAMIKLQDRLSFKQAKIAVAVAFILGFLFSIVQISYDFQNEKKKVEGTVAQVMRALKAPATIAAHNLDEELASKVVDSLLEYHPVYSATLYSDFDYVLASKQRPIKSPGSRNIGDFMLDKEHIYTLALLSDQDNQPVGRLAIKVDGQVTASNFFDRSIMTVALGFTRNLILVFILTVFFYLTLTNPLAALAETIAQADPENPDENNIPLDPLHENDELGLVTRSLRQYMEDARKHIIEQQKTEIALKESEQRFKDVAESASDWVWEMGPDHKVSYVSDRIQEVTKISPFDFLGKSLLENGHIEVSQELLIENGEKLKAREPFRNFNCDFKIDKGKRLHWSLSGKPIFNSEGEYAGYRGIGRDITEQKQAELAQQEVEERFRATFEQAAVGIAHLAEDGSFLRVNQTLCDFLGYPKAVMLKKTAKDITHEDDWEQSNRLVISVMKGEKASTFFESRYKKPNGEIFWGYISLNSVVATDGTQKYYVAVIEDISDRKKQEAERRQLEEQLHQSQKLETIGRLAGGIAHDFNNILTPVLGYAELVLRKLPEDSPLRDKVERIATASTRASGLVKQILTFSRQGETSSNALELAPLIDEVLKLIRASFPANIYIHTYLDGDVPPVLIDQTQAHQLVMNLCTNSAQAMGHEGGVLEISLKKIHLRPGENGLPLEAVEGTYTCLAIKDTGEGISEEEQERIFEPFFTTKEVGKGTGLGLSMVHGIVIRNKGYITLESAIGKGSLFAIYLPAADPADIPVGASEDSKGGVEHILFVDDEPDNVDLAQEMLVELGYSIEGFTNSLKALEAFKASPDKYDLVISDQTMPFLTGDFLAKEILGIRPEMPILIITGFSETLSKEESQRIGIRDYLTKPLKMADLDIAIRKVFS